MRFRLYPSRGTPSDFSLPFPSLLKWGHRENEAELSENLLVEIHQFVLLAQKPLDVRLVHPNP